MKKALIVSDGRFFKDKNENFYAESLYNYAFYERYLVAFNQIYVMARVETIKECSEKSKKVSGKGVTFLSLPTTRGPKGYLFGIRRLRRLIKKYVSRFDIVIVRVPSAIGNLAAEEVLRERKKLFLEVVVDPWLFFSPGTIKSITTPIVRVLWTHELKKLCSSATGISYVTKDYLQKKYPPSKNKAHIVTNYSSVELPDDSFGKPKVYNKKEKYTISHAANTFNGYGKGHMEVIKTIKRVREKGYDVSAIFIGDGPLKDEFMSYAREIGVLPFCNFVGRLPSNSEVRQILSESDLLILPSKGEGLPRIILEAMAEGLPVISTPICGIPEVVSPQQLFSYDDIEGMANEVCRLIDNPKELSRLSEENLNKAYEYRKSKLQEERNEFYKRIISLVFG